jgi:hypothetical protein
MVSFVLGEAARRRTSRAAHGKPRTPVDVDVDMFAAAAADDDDVSRRAR